MPASSPKSMSHAKRVDQFKSPMPNWEDEIGPRYVPFWQTMTAALAALGSIAFAWLLLSKL